MGALPSIHCCQEEPLDAGWNSEDVFDLSGEQVNYCKVDVAPVLGSSGYVPSLESLSYEPVRFEQGPTIDVERSQARYSKIVVHSVQARQQRRHSKPWEDWLRDATCGGRGVTLLGGISDVETKAEAPGVDVLLLEKIPATYHLDYNLTKLSILPASGVQMATIVIPVNSIQVICPATDFMLVFDQVETKLTDAEKGRAVLLQYAAAADESGEVRRRRACFLEESASSKDRFVQALTTLWLEKRNDANMWS